MNLSELSKIYQKKKQRVLKGKAIAGFVNTRKETFLEWFTESRFELGCYHCGTSNEVSETLFKAQLNKVRNDATRGGKRGKRLELDRKDPKLPYDNLSNLAWCCYWCNNAKTNFFTEEEFKPIAQEIGKSIKKIYLEICNKMLSSN